MGTERRGLRTWSWGLVKWPQALAATRCWGDCALEPLRDSGPTIPSFPPSDAEFGLPASEPRENKAPLQAAKPAGVRYRGPRKPLVVCLRGADAWTFHFLPGFYFPPRLHLSCRLSHPCPGSRDLFRSAPGPSGASHRLSRSERLRQKSRRAGANMPVPSPGGQKPGVGLPQTWLRGPASWVT